jgi:Tfp pilus assembly protein PilF
MLALSQLRLGKYQEADAELDGLLKAVPNHLWGRLVRAALNAQRGDLDAAFADLEVAAVQGYDARLLLNEPLFEPLWTDPRFTATLRGPRRARKK